MKVISISGLLYLAKSIFMHPLTSLFMFSKFKSFKFLSLWCQTNTQTTRCWKCIFYSVKYIHNWKNYLISDSNLRKLISKVICLNDFGLYHFLRKYHIFHILNIKPSFFKKFTTSSFLSVCPTVHFYKLTLLYIYTYQNKIVIRQKKK